MLAVKPPIRLQCTEAQKCKVRDQAERRRNKLQVYGWMGETGMFE